MEGHRSVSRNESCLFEVFCIFSVKFCDFVSECFLLQGNSAAVMGIGGLLKEMVCLAPCSIKSRMLGSCLELHSVAGLHPT